MKFAFVDDFFGRPFSFFDIISDRFVLRWQYEDLCPSAREVRQTVYSYGVGCIGQSAAYNFIGVYFVLFLTDSVGITSSLAGTISSLALCVEVVMGMLVGNLSDNCTSKMGRRGPFVLFSTVVMFPVLILMMYTIEASEVVQFFYYLILAILFRISFASFEIPFNALGAEIVFDYDERTKLRTIGRFVSILGNAVAYILPLLILEQYANNEQGGWFLSGVIIAIVTSGSWLFAFLRTAKKGTVLSKDQVKKQKNPWKGIVKNYLELIKLKTTRILIVYKATFTCAFAMFNVATMYYLQYCVGVGNKYSSYMYTLTIIVFIVATPFANKMALVMGKSKQQMYTMLTCGLVGIFVYLLGPSTPMGAIVYIGTFSVMQTTFWQLSGSIFYDVIEVDEYVNHQRREGDLMSLSSVLGTFISAIIVQAFGISLEWAGYNPELTVQPSTVEGFLNLGYILIPSVCMVIGGVALKLFPINKKSFEALQEVLRRRAAGEDYSEFMDEIHKIVGKK